MSERRRGGAAAAGLLVKGAGSVLSWKVLLAAGLAAVVLIAGTLGVGGIAMFGTVTTAASNLANCTPGGAAARVSGVPEGGFAGYSHEAMERAAIGLKTAADLGVGHQGQLILLIMWMQESTLGDNPDTHGPDSNGDAGLAQQRIIPGWYGTEADVNDPAKSATMFILGHDITYAGPESAGPPGYHLPGLVDIKGWESMEAGAAAQAVQVSDYPGYYTKHIANAEKIIAHLAGASVSPASDEGGEAAAVDCTGGGTGDVQGATTMDQLPHYPMPDGCTDQTPLFSEYGRDTLNGHVPDTALCSYPGATDSDGRGQARAVAAYVAMNVEFKKQFGHDLLITSTYRTYDKQVSTKASKGYLAATPGWSNHGFGLAIDIGGTSAEKAWIQQNGPTFGWWHPLWARPDGRKPENWHYEYGTWLVAPEYEGMDPGLIAY
ncbi:M15 family metallopeptidase (plasmid) [Brachybacterium huguangmaarense]|uniref:M15 family metallopeptidase n=1 Tax=Brachybacterium huguangmaarense TaxID=1652028 RepID=A0ABY6G5T4_9MICO|nr:M15 family metallopeptidase [Brachybacterium huguangmaarense]UYG18324.1 M15 family metallopeptidase [Brachybacterium huguangmaarense]